MNKLIILLFGLLVCTIKANQPNVFNKDAETSVSASTFSTLAEESDSDAPIGPPGGGVGGNGTGQAVSIDMYELGLLLVGGFIIMYRTDVIRRKKVRITH